MNVIGIMFPSKIEKIPLLGILNKLKQKRRMKILVRLIEGIPFCKFNDV